MQIGHLTVPMIAAPQYMHKKKKKKKTLNSYCASVGSGAVSNQQQIQNNMSIYLEFVSTWWMQITPLSLALFLLCLSKGPCQLMRKKICGIFCC